MAATVAALALVGLAGVALADGSPEVRLAKITVAGRPLAHFQGAWANARRDRNYLADQSNASLDTHTNMLVEQIAGFAGWSGNADTSGSNGIVSTSPDQLVVGRG